MSLNWIKWTKGLTRKREIVIMANRLGISPREMAAVCMEVWEWADDNTENGNVLGVTLVTLDRFTGVTGLGAQLAAPDIGWVIEGDGITFPHFDRHNGNSAKKRALGSKRVSEHRDRKRYTCNASVTQKALPEKSREEKSIYPLNPPTGDERRAAPDEPMLFDAFWDAWPKSSRKVNRVGCLKKWKAKKLDSEADAIMAGLAAWKRSHDWTKDNGEYIPQPATWLNQRRWETPVEPANESESGLIWEQAPITDAVLRAIDGE